jgi:hypothetical protein
MDDVLGWGTIVTVISVPVIFVVVAFSIRRRPASGNGRVPSSGGLLGLDELFHPSAHNARVVWEAEREIPAPAPTPDKGPGVIESSGRITIEVTGSGPQTSPTNDSEGVSLTPSHG